MTKKTTTPKKDKTLLESVAMFQYEAPILLKNTEGYGYKYVDLAEIIRVITPILKKHDLFILQPLVNNGIKTIIGHWPSGQIFEEFTEIPQDISLAKMNPYQAQGAGITYWRRYALSSFLGLVSDKDIDMGGKTQTKKPKLSTDRFNEALHAIQNGNYSIDELKTNFELTANQLKKLS